nr:hypothetical protein HmN_000500800 [Hymenolepis microstoma]
MSDDLKKYQPPLPERDVNDPLVQATFETTSMESQKVKKFARLPSNWATWERARKAKENVSRKVDRLLNDYPVPAEDWFTAKSTRQYACDIYSLLQYFKFISEQVLSGDGIISKHK